MASLPNGLFLRANELLRISDMFEDEDINNPWAIIRMHINLASAAIKGRLTFLFILHLVAMWWMFNHFLGS